MNRTEALILITKFSIEEFIAKIAHLNLSEKRAKQFFEVINGTKYVDHFCKFDIEEYALKIIFPDFYSEIQTTDHRYSTCEFYEFDPAKNGQNIVKHGLSFNEVVSYSFQKFGTLSIICPDEQDHQRIVYFSDLLLKEKYKQEYKLELPLSELNDENYTLSIAKQLDGKIRFISSRFLSSKKQKYTETVKQAIRSIKFPDKASRKVFVGRCIEIIERDLITDHQSNVAKLDDKGKFMYLFDRVEEQNINGTFEVFAVNEQENKAYPLREVTIRTSENAMEGFSLRISCHPEEYIYRGSFNSADEMKNFADNVLRLLNDADRKNQWNLHA